MCRRWKLYRFDVDCGGQRVPWVALSAAADSHSGGRSWVEARRSTSLLKDFAPLAGRDIRLTARVGF